MKFDEVDDVEGAMSRGYCCLRSISVEVITFASPLPTYKMFLQSYKKDIKQISSGSTKLVNFVGDFCRYSKKKKLKTLAQYFQVSIHLHLCHLF